MATHLLFILAGYLSGSVLFADLVGKLLRKEPFLQESEDGNPGASNAFRYGGFFCGALTLLGDILKGFLPVFLYLRWGGDMKLYPVWGALVLAAPVIGHVFPVFFGFHGGKGIAVTFGCLLGLLPAWRPFADFALAFIALSTIVQIKPHFYRTAAAYPAALLLMTAASDSRGLTLGFLIITAVVLFRLHRSTEPRAPMEVSLLWKR